MANSSDPVAASRLVRAQQVQVRCAVACALGDPHHGGRCSAFFRQISILGAEHLPTEGPVLLAPIPRPLGYLDLAQGGRPACQWPGLPLHVTTTEMSGLQGWFLRRLGCFAIDQSKPGTASLRYALDLLAEDQQVVLFPEGRINRDQAPITVAPGLPRLASLAQTKGLGSVPVIPIGIAYSRRLPRWGDSAALCLVPSSAWKAVAKQRLWPWQSAFNRACVRLSGPKLHRRW